MQSYVMGDGRWHHRLRQSWLKSADTCPEQARLDHVKKLPERETDAANIGTAVHTVIENALSRVDTVTLKDCLLAFDEAWAARVEALGDQLQWVKYSPKSALAFGRECTFQWHANVYPHLYGQPCKLEAEFCVPFYEDETRLVELSGTIDYVGDDSHVAPLKDWKTSSRGEYVEWEKKRWDIQSMVYTYAATHEGWVVPEPDDSVNFEFVVMFDGGVQRLVLRRGPEHWAWLKAKVESTCLLIEADLPTWPKQDNHALCSPKWCSAWDFCKGASGITY